MKKNSPKIAIDSKKKKIIKQKDNGAELLDIYDPQMHDRSTNIKYPLSDNVIDQLDADIDKFNESNNLGEKIIMHDKLVNLINNLQQEIDSMIDIVDKIDMDDVNKIMKSTNSSQIFDESNELKHDSNDDIITLEKMFDGMQEEDVMQTKIKYLEKIINNVKKCKANCEINKMKIAKCN